MNPDGFVIRRRLDGRDAARLAFDEALAGAQRQVRVFDHDGRFWSLERSVVAQMFDALLKAAPDTRVTIVLHDVEPLRREAPRLLAVLRSFAPRLQVLATDASIRSYARGVAIFDDTVVLRRPHFEQPTAWLDHDEAAIASAAALFDEVLAHTVPGISSQVTGL